MKRVHPTTVEVKLHVQNILNFAWIEFYLYKDMCTDESSLRTIITKEWIVYTLHISHSTNFMKGNPVRDIIPSAVCLSKRLLHSDRSSSFSFSLAYPLVSVRSFSSCLRLVPLLPVTSISPSIFISVTCFRRQFLRNK